MGELRYILEVVLHKIFFLRGRVAMSKLDSMVDLRVHQYDLEKNGCLEFQRPIKSEIISQEVNWIERQNIKDSILKFHLKIQAAITTLVLVFVVVPFWFSSDVLGKSLFLPIMPVLAMTLSWMVAAWYFYDKGRMLFFALTFGAIPIRLGICLLWVLMTLVLIPDLMEGVYVFGLMVYWILFTACEISMALQFSKKLGSVGRLEPNW